MIFQSGDWRFIGTEIRDQRFYRIFRETTTGAIVLLRPTRHWQNPVWKVDVDADGRVIALDVIRLINMLNGAIDGDLVGPNNEYVDPLTRFDIPDFFPDVNGNHIAGPDDVLFVINFINDQLNGEGEAPTAIAASTPAAFPIRRETSPYSGKIGPGIRIAGTEMAWYPLAEPATGRSSQPLAVTGPKIDRAPVVGKQSTLRRADSTSHDKFAAAVDRLASDQWFDDLCVLNFDFLPAGQ